MSHTYRDWLDQLRSRLPEVRSRELASELNESEHAPLLVDVRERDEWSAGHVPGAVHLTRGFLELRIEQTVPDRARPLVLYCAGGVRSLFATEALNKLGYSNVRSLEGGFSAWKAAGLPIARSAQLNDSARERYARHLVIPEVGEAGQQRLLESKVLLVGAGGLGSPAAMYLAAAGVGTLGIIDHDVVDRTNLQRQILHTDDRVDRPKVESARTTLRALNPEVKIASYQERLDSGNVDEIVAEYDLILDGADNFPTRYLVNDTCVKHCIPNVHGSVFRFEGQVTVFWPGKGPCYRCLYPEPPPPELAPNCAEAGVLGVLPGVVGVLEAVETVKILLGIGDPLIGRLLVYDALAARFLELRVRANPDCRYCKPGAAFPGYVDYEEFCATGPRETPDVSSSGA